MPSFNSRSVLITGGAGFIGSHLAEALLAKNYHVTVIDDLSTGRFENIAPLTDHPNFRFAIDTITNEVVMDRLVSECDMIFHLAAAVGVMLIVEQPVHTIQTNIAGTEVVYKTALRYKTKVLVASTSEVYGKGNQIPFSEDDDVVLGPTSRSRWSYAVSKMVDEFLGLAYYREKGLPVVVFRLFNTVGPRQTGRYGMVIPRFVQQALDGEKITVYGDGNQTRCFLHVRDAVRAIIALSESSEADGRVFNIGDTQEISILNLARKVIQMTSPEEDKYQDPDERIQFIPYDQAYAEGFEDMHRRVPDVSRIYETVGWESDCQLENILNDVILDIKQTSGDKIAVPVR
ncbi:MAG: GDP-mannose 4,6-dehydratase [Chloroflexota bacterium]|nr:MAG: GDP-mannose 4,6-dehydratase [Chloroflexota bacterium]